MDDDVQEEDLNPQRRPYHSNKRTKQAQSTQQAILSAGRMLFKQQGYTATTVAEIAAEAGVAVPTVYASAGGKRGILLSLVELVDQLADQELIKASLEAEDPQQIIALAVKFNRQAIERGGDILTLLFKTAVLNEDVMVALQQGLTRHRQGAGMLAHLLHSRNYLQAGLTEERAGDIIATLLMPFQFETLRDYGWSFDECESWLNRLLISALLTQPPS